MSIVSLVDVVVIIIWKFCFVFFKKIDSYCFMLGMIVSWLKIWVDLLWVDRGSL